MRPTTRLRGSLSRHRSASGPSPDQERPAHRPPRAAGLKTVAKCPVNEEPEIFKPSQRLTFTRWGVPFEIDVTAEHRVARYDRRKLEEERAKGNDLNPL